MAMGFIALQMVTLTKETGTSIKNMDMVSIHTLRQEQAIVECGRQEEKRDLETLFTQIINSVVCKGGVGFHYSRVPNKRGGVRIIGGLEMVRYNNNRGGRNNGGRAWRNIKQPFS